jgi:hypothetical protein
LLTFTFRALSLLQLKEKMFTPKGATPRFRTRIQVSLQTQNHIRNSFRLMTKINRGGKSCDTVPLEPMSTHRSAGEVLYSIHIGRL